MRISDWSSDVCSSDLCFLNRSEHGIWRIGGKLQIPVWPFSCRRPARHSRQPENKVETIITTTNIRIRGFSGDDHARFGTPDRDGIDSGFRTGFWLVYGGRPEGTSPRP